MEVFTRNTNASLIVNNSDPSITPKVSILKHKPKEIKNDKKLFTPGNVVKVTISKIIAPSQIITEYVGGYIGRLSLIDISWSLPQSEQVFKKYKIGDSIDCVIFLRDYISQK
mgnify:FL=1